MQHRLPTLLTSLALGITFAGAALMLIGSEAKARPAALMTAEATEAVDLTINPKVQEVFDKQAAADNPTTEQSRNFVANIRGLMADHELRSGTDYALAAAVIAKGDTVQDALLAHDLAVCALALGNQSAKPLIASTQDLILTRLGHKQRYGTSVKNGQLEPVEKEVPDSMRLILGLPSLREAKRLVAMGKPVTPKLGSSSMLQPMMRPLPMKSVTAVAQ